MLSGVTVPTTNSQESNLRNWTRHDILYVQFSQNYRVQLRNVQKLYSCFVLIVPLCCIAVQIIQYIMLVILLTKMNHYEQEKYREFKLFTTVCQSLIKTIHKAKCIFSIAQTISELVKKTWVDIALGIIVTKNVTNNLSIQIDELYDLI